MSKCIWLCSKKTLSYQVENTILNICKNISPDNIVPAEPKVVVSSNVAYGIMNPNSTLFINGNSLLLGMIFGNTDNWDIPFQDFPDGSFALFRDGIENCEIVSDPVASRTIWYYMNDEIFLASTSQRAIIMFIGGFEFDKRVVPWMLSTGSLGPTFSWDKRIKRIPPDSSVILNKNNWSLTTKSDPIEFKEYKDTDEYHEQKLRAVLTSTFESLKFNYSDWVLPLSGGYDSRGILCLLHSNSNVKDLKTITWGLKSSLNDEKNDAFIAQNLAKVLNVSHKYFHTNLSEEPIEKILDRFILNGEGRIDHISAYLDGFKIWENLFKADVKGIIRGDEGFGWPIVSSPLVVRLAVGLNLCSDYSNLKDYTKYGIHIQEIPGHLERLDSESLDQWKDRLYHEYRIPTILAALSDLKLPYLEVVNPLLSKTILQQVRKLPDHLRMDKALFKKIVASICPKIAFATRPAIAEISEILKQKRVVELLNHELSSKFARELLPEEFLTHILEKIKVSDNGSLNKGHPFSLKSSILRLLPRYLKNAIRDKVSLTVSADFNTLAFRVYIIIKMNKILKDKFF